MMFEVVSTARLAEYAKQHAEMKLALFSIAEAAGVAPGPGDPPLTEEQLAANVIRQIVWMRDLLQEAQDTIDDVKRARVYGDEL